MKDLNTAQLAGKKVLFATVPAAGHFNPLISLAKYLQELGCDVRWYTSSLFAGRLRNLSILHYTYDKAWGIESIDVNEILAERRSIKDELKRIEFDLSNFFVNRANEYFFDIQQIEESFHFDLMISDHMFSAMPLVKKEMNIPVISIGVASADLTGVSDLHLQFGRPDFELDTEALTPKAIQDIIEEFIEKNL